MTAPKEMFLPGSRSEWTAIVRPPEGYRLQSAIGTTFSLDFTALTAVLLASLDQQSNLANWDDRAHLLHAITRVGDRVRVLVNRGQIHIDVRPSNKMFALFDQMVEEVRLPHGSFHPKVWILKYSRRQAVDIEEHVGGTAGGTERAAAHDAIYRLICTSRNLTLASTWEAVVSVDGCIARTGDGVSVETGRNLASFFERLALADPMPQSVQTLVKDLRRVAFSTEGSKAVQSCEFLWQWPGTKPLEHHIDSGGKTALVVSPFIGITFLQSLVKKFNAVIVVSRQQELDAHWGTIQHLIPLNHLWVVKASDGGDGAEDVPSLELHAKILICEYGRHSGAEARTEAWVGSANASGRAWGLAEMGKRMNCEAMIRCRPAIRPAQFLDQFAYQENASVLNGWVERYQPRDVGELTGEEKADELLEHVSKEVAARDLRARLDRAGESVALTLDAPDRRAWATLFATQQGVHFEVCPLGISDGRPFSDLKDVAASSIRFDGMSVAQVGAFVSIRLTHLATGRKKQFAVKVTLTNMDEAFWEERRTAFLKTHLDAKAFREFLRCILFGGTLAREPVTGSGEGPKKEPASPPVGQVESLLDDFTIEDVLHSCTEDSSRIEEIDRLLKTFENTGHVDAAFVQFWANFRSAVRTLKGDAPQ